ncbi:DUF4365 domain-containing protein [Glycomyces sambucus]
MTSNQRTGAFGQSRVKAQFEDLGCAPIPNPEHDFGTDLYIQLANLEGNLTGAFIGAQIKTGKSFFKEEVHGRAGVVEGWWFREDLAHYDYWMTHQVPHVVILYNKSEQTAYWSQITKSRCKLTKKGFKVFVPSHQVVDFQHLGSLIRVASSASSAISLEGTAWDSSKYSMPQGSKMRHSFIAPRLVAPHGNRQIDTIGYHEAIALQIQGRGVDYSDFLDSNRALKEAADTWGWQFARTVNSFTSGLMPDEFSSELLQLGSAPTEDVPGAIVFLACMHMERGNFHQAKSVLENNTITENSVDNAWIKTQIARCELETGNLEAAKVIINNTIIELLRVKNDVTATAILGAATKLRNTMLDYRNASIQEMISAADNIASWWRSKTVSIGATKVLVRNFRQWAGDTSQIIFADDVANNSLFAAQIQANLTGDRDDWRTYLSFSGQNTLLDKTDDRSIQIALSDLKLSGDAKTLELATRKICDDGPLQVLRKFATSIRNSNWSYTTSLPNLMVWKNAGELLSESDADEAASYCIDAILGRQSALHPSTLTGFSIGFRVFEALSGIMNASSVTSHQRVLETLIEIDERSFEHPEISRCLKRLKWDRINPELIDSLINKIANLSNSSTSNSILGLISRHRTSARDILLDRFTSDADAALSIEYIGGLSEHAANDLIQDLAYRVERLCSESSTQPRTYPPDPAPAFLAQLNSLHQSIACWDPVLTYLSSENIDRNDKYATCQIISRLHNKIADRVRTSLTESIGKIRLQSSSYAIHNFMSRNIDGVLLRAEYVLGVIPPESINLSVIAAIHGAAEIRRDIAEFAALDDTGQLGWVLSNLLNDGDAQVRALVTQGIAHWISNDRAEPWMVSYARSLPDGDGTRLPLAFVIGMCNPTSEQSQLVLPTLTHFSTHPSARVRRIAGEKLAKVELEQEKGV